MMAQLAMNGSFNRTWIPGLWGPIHLTIKCVIDTHIKQTSGSHHPLGFLHWMGSTLHWLGSTHVITSAQHAASIRAQRNRWACEFIRNPTDINGQVDQDYKWMKYLKLYYVQNDKTQNIHNIRKHYKFLYLNFDDCVAMINYQQTDYWWLIGCN